MANRIWNDVKTTRHGVRKVMCRFFPNGTSNDALTVRGSGVKGVVRNAAAGVFVVTLEDKWKTAQLIGFSATVQHTTAADLVAQLGDFTDGTASVDSSVIVRVNAAATPTDITANANSSVSVELTFQNNPRS
jgi:hypothetical protein